MNVDPPVPTRRRKLGAWLVTAMILLATAALVVLVLGLPSASGPDITASSDAARSSSPPSTRPAAPSPVRLVAVGDSITVAGGDIPSGFFTDLSWVRYAVGEPVVPHGGWAVSGATTAQMAAGFVPPVGEPYVLVIFGGTNDVGLRLPFSQSRANMVAIADRAQDATRVLVIAIPPLTGMESNVARYNADLAALAAERGWTFVDPMAAVSTQGRWVEGMTHDGIHPTAQGARLIGAGIRAAVLAEPAQL